VSGWTFSIDVPATIRGRKGDDELSIKMDWMRESLVRTKGFLNGIPMPTEWYEIQHLAQRETTKLLPADVLAFMDGEIAAAFVVSGGLPLVWQCSRRHARYYRAVMRDRPWWKFEIVNGTLAGRPAIVDATVKDGEDEQIVLLRKESK
jgi:hypothetical protein